MQSLPLPGCRHDVLGHYLKAIGILRVLAVCAEPEYRDPEAEGWWDVAKACFMLRSCKYPTAVALVEFFRTHYIPTPIMAAWNKATGADKATTGKLGATTEFEIATEYAKRVVSAEERKKNPDSSTMNSSESFAAYRDDARHNLSQVLDAVSVPRFCRNADNPLFLIKGLAGRAHMWRTYWEYLRDFSKQRAKHQSGAFDSLILASLINGPKPQAASGKRIQIKGKGTPFFPEEIKRYNTGSGWVQENYPFNTLDYILSVEGALALRGSVARAMGATSRRYAAFPFVFDSAEDKVDYRNQVRGTAASLWLPIWVRPTTFVELSSFIGDAQARLPEKDVRLSAEFVRALNAQGVDAGFAGWQEFRFKMKGSDVPWATTGPYVSSYGPDNSTSNTPREATLLNLALAPLDKSRFLDQFEIKSKGGKALPNSPHFVQTQINRAMETAALDPNADNCMALLETVWRACRKICISERFRQALRGGRASFFAPLPMVEWEDLLRPLAAQPEFRIARALASIAGSGRPDDEKHPAAQPMLGSLLPLRLGRSGWNLAPKDKRQQCVWTGEDLCRDLAMVFRRRYLDSLDDDTPALRGARTAQQNDAIAFLRGDLNDHLIARWTEALSLIGWQSVHTGTGDRQDLPDQEEEPEVPDLAHAALRTLLELECEPQGRDQNQWKKRRSEQPFALMCERSALSLASAVSEALRWISIWGLPNPWGPAASAEKPRLSGRYIIRLDQTGASRSVYDHHLTARLPAAVCIPLRWRDRNRLRQLVTLPPEVD